MAVVAACIPLASAASGPATSGGPVRSAAVRPALPVGAVLTSASNPRVFTPPPSIAADCSVDVANPLRAWLWSLPKGTPTSPVVVSFPAGACYQVDESLFLRGFTDTVFEGNGATFRQVTPRSVVLGPFPADPPYCGASVDRLAGELSTIPPIIFWFEGGCDLTIEGLHIVGPNVTGRVGSMIDSGIQLTGVQRVLVQDVTVTDVDGDFVTMMGLHEARSQSSYPTTDVTIRDNTFTRSGRQGITSVYTDRVLVTHNTITQVAFTAIDLEADVTGGCECNETVTGNTFVGAAPYLVAALTGAALDNFAFTDNTLVKGAQLKIDLAPALDSHGILIAGNTGDTPAQWPFPSVLVGTEPSGDSTGTVSDVSISDNHVPANDNGRTFVQTGATNVASIAVRNNDIPSPSPLTVVSMEALLPSFDICGDITSPGGAPVYGPCQPYTPPPTPAQPTLPPAVVVPDGSGGGGGAGG